MTWGKKKPVTVERVFAAVVVAFGLIGGGAAFATSPAFASTSSPEVPSLTGKALNKAVKTLESMKLKPEIDAAGRAVWAKKNWVVLDQKPAAGVSVKAGAKITLVVVKKADLLSKGQAVGACRGLAKTDPDIEYGITFPSREWVAQKQRLGWAVDLDAWLVTATGGKVAARVYCELSGTREATLVDVYEVTTP